MDAQAMRCENWKAHRTPALMFLWCDFERAFWLYARAAYAISSSRSDEKGVPVGPFKPVIMYFSFASSNAYTCAQS